MEQLKIKWYGRCCFLIEYKKKRFLFDPYDTYCGVDIGQIEADVVVISSTWHDHGHIGASPLAHIYSYPGQYEHKEVIITGVEAKEDRGSPTVIFNLKIGPYSITNFADFGPERKQEFDNAISNKERKIIESTNVVFIRPSIEMKSDGSHFHNETALDYCDPKIIIPEHYFPRSFILKNVPEQNKENFLNPVERVDEMVEIFQYPVKRIDNFKVSISPNDIKTPKIIRFLKLHSQVTYAGV